MFAFSEIHDADNEPAVKQILVFSSEQEKQEYNPETGPNTSSYKLRAVLNGQGRWDGVIRSGRNGQLLLDQKNLGDSWQSAMVSVHVMFNGFITESINKNFRSVLLETKKDE